MTKDKTEILTVMFVDMVDYTKTTSKLDRERFHKLHDVFDNHVSGVVGNYTGKIIKKLGDAFLITFKSSTEAVLCGKALQIEFQNYNRTAEDYPIKIRVAIHAGEVVYRYGDIYGDVVNLTSRIESIVKEGDVVFSELVYSSMNKNEVMHKYIGKFQFKGADKPLNLFKIKTEEDFIREKRIIKKRKIKKMKKKLRFFSTRIIGLALSALILYLILINLDSIISFLSF